jgi:hypothetical protein
MGTEHSQPRNGNRTLPKRYNISNNFFFQADATKMDYGGHDQVFNDNVIYVRDSDGQNCFNQGSYLEGHGMEYVKTPKSYLKQHILTLFVLSIIGLPPLLFNSYGA